jgi:CubicO group peptidase (beta-lactamase class C family)
MRSRNSLYILAIVLAMVSAIHSHAYTETVQNERREMPLPTLHFPGGKTVVEVPFQVESGWIVLPVSVNGSRPLRFVLDSGAPGAVLTNPAIVDSLNLKITGKAQARGAGGGGASFEVSVAENVNFGIGGIELSNGHLAISPAMRPGIDGVIGRSIFANLVVEIDWEKQIVKLYEPTKYKYSGSGTVLPLTFDEGGRPYTMASVTATDDKPIPVKLVVDTGGSHTLMLEVGSNSQIKLPESATKTVLGRGASGEITGHTGRTRTLELGGQTFNDVPTIFPDSSSGTAGLNERQGNLGSGILRRFKVVYDYSRKQMIVEPNKFANDRFGTPLPVAATSSVTTTPATLQDYVGTYGNKEISVRDGGLYFQRVGGRGAALRQTAKDKFALNTDAQVTFGRNAAGVVTEMIVEWVDRDKEQLKKETAAAADPPTQKVDEDAVPTKELDAYLEQAAASDAFSGAVLIAKNDRPIFEKAYGMANRSNSTPNKIDTKFDLGSMNKMFTSVAIAQLVESGKLSFTDTVAKLLPDYPNKVVAEKVSVHQLLTHTSGLGNYQNETYIGNLNKMKAVADLLPLFANEPLAFEPGTKMVYSNSGFVVLGLIIEKVSGQNYFDYVKEHIFKPAGMVNTDSYEQSANVANMAIGYMRMNDKGMPDPSLPLRENTAIRPAKGSPAGGGYSTLGDMLRFSLALRGNKLLSKKYTDIVTTGKVEVAGPDRKYAYGFGDNVIDGKHIVGHNGGGPGVGANFDMFPEAGYTTVILTNFSPPAMMPVVKKVRDLMPTSSASASYVPQAAAVPQPGQAPSQSEQEVRKLEREWLNAYEQHDAAAMNRILADEFILTNSDGTVQTKAQIMEMIGSQRPGAGPSFTFSTEDTQVRVDGDTVILSGRVLQKGQRNGQSVIMQSRYSDTYVKRQGRWQVVASQLSSIAKP